MQRNDSRSWQRCRNAAISYLQRVCLLLGSFALFSGTARYSRSRQESRMQRNDSRSWQRCRNGKHGLMHITSIRRPWLKTSETDEGKGNSDESSFPVRPLHLFPRSSIERCTCTSSTERCTSVQSSINLLVTMLATGTLPAQNSSESPQTRLEILQIHAGGRILPKQYSSLCSGTGSPPVFG